MDEPAFPKNRSGARRRLQSSAALAVIVVASTVGVGYGLLKLFAPEPTRPVAPVLRNGTIAFVASTNPDQPENYDVFSVSPDGTGIEQLTDDPAPEYDPAWSPNGTRIAFARERVDDRGDEVSMGIYVMNADGSDVKGITTGKGVHDRSPTWSPDGSMLAFSSNRKGFSDIWLVNADGTGLRQLTDLSEKGVDYAGLPAWSPDGSVIAFRRSPLEPSEELEPQGIWLVDVGSGEMVELTEGPILDEDANWSPDGRRLAFSRKIWTGNEGYTDVYVANLAEGTETSLTRGGDPAWSPDGTKIAFNGGHPRELGIYIMDADGSNVVRIPTPPELASSPISPAWQPLPARASSVEPTVDPTAARTAAGICNRPLIKTVRVEVLQPLEGQTVNSPVLVHLMVTDPPGCDATYHVRVDGIPYMPLGQAGGQPPFTRSNPDRTRPISRSSWTSACVSTFGHYLSIRLAPGPHSLTVGGCPQGTAVPLTLPVTVRFRVAEPGQSAGSSPVAGRPVIYRSGDVTLIEDPTNVCPIDSLVPSPRDIELLEGAVVRALEAGVLGATEPPLDTSGARASAHLVTEDSTFQAFVRTECDASVWNRQVGIEIRLPKAVSASMSQQRYVAAKVRRGWILWFLFHP